ncbi:MAG: serpin family protein [Acidimicrobiales bacterium]
MNQLSRRSFMIALVAAMAASCGSDSGLLNPDPSAPTTLPPSSDPDIVQISDLDGSFERVAGDMSPEALASAVAGDRQLASALYTKLSGAQEGNMVFSPFSIATAFSMVTAGAAGATRSELEDALGAGPGWDAARNGLDQKVQTPSQLPEGATPLELDIVTTPYGQAGFEFETEYVRTLAENYGAIMRLLDFMANPDAARNAINSDVETATRGRITDLLPQGTITELARLVLVNTVFFKAVWVDEFQVDQTTTAPFTRLDRTTVDVPMMNGHSRTTFGEGEGWQSVRLGYWGGYSMMVIVPGEGRFSEIEAQLADGLLDEISSIRNDHGVRIALPKFDFKTSADLTPLFNELGVVEAFTPEADFSGISSQADLYISGAFHQATIEVDEVGTTATAATALVVSATSAPPPAEIRADRPFIFVIEHDETGEPLFIGRVVDPSA